MSILRITLFVLGLSALIPVALPSTAEATTVVRAGVSTHGHYRPYYRGYYPYYRGYYPYYNYYRPYYYGLGWGWGWGGGWGGYAPYYYAPGAVYYGYGYGEVRTEIKPQQARVYVDGDYAGVTDDYDGWWQGLHLAPGKYRLVFRAEGFTPYVVNLKVYPGADYHLKYDMQPGQDVISEQEMLPEREERDERDRGNGNYDRNYDRYRNDDKYREDRDYNNNNPDYQERYQPNERDREYNNKDDWEQQRPSQRNQGTMSVPQQSVPQERELSDKRELHLQVQPSDATVYIDGTYYGTTGNGGDVRVLLPDGPHRIEVVRPGYESFEKDLTISANSPGSLTVMLQKK